MKNAPNEIGNKPDALKSRLEEAEEKNSELQDDIMENKTKKELWKTRIDLGNSVTPSIVLTYVLLGVVEGEVGGGWGLLGDEH